MSHTSDDERTRCAVANAKASAGALSANALPRWRPATSDDALVVAMSAALNVEDRGPNPVPEAHTVRTLRMLREEPWRGRVVVLADAETLHG
jgi:hypothetical protein